MNSLSDFFVYLFWPNPGNADYSNPKALTLMILCLVCIAASFAVRHWRKKQHNAPTKKLSRTWPSALFWFGLVGAFLVVCRVEEISFISMRIWWLVWAIIAIIYVFVQVKMFRMRHYQVLPQQKAPEEQRDKYLPKKKKK